MKKHFTLIFIFFGLSLFTHGFAADSSMAAPQQSNYMQYEERVTIGLFFENTSKKASKIQSDFKIMGRPYDLDIKNSGVYGLTGVLPLNNWIGLYALGAYQYWGIHYKDKNLNKAYQNLAELQKEDLFCPIDSSDIKGVLDAHHIIFQAGMETGIPLFSSYNYQTMLKIYSFLGITAGRVYYPNSEFMNSNLWGGSWGVGLRGAFYKVSLSSGFRFSSMYSRTHFEELTTNDPDNDTFMLNPHNFGELFFSIHYALF